MKLFKNLLVAPATLGLLAPLAVSAAEVNFNDVSAYSNRTSDVNINSFKPLSNKNPLLSGGEGLSNSSANDFSADSFSSTTTLDGKAVFALGAVDGNNDVSSSNTQRTTAMWVYQMNLNTSFTGDDNLYVRLKSAAGWDNFADKPYNYLNEAGGITGLEVDKIWYTIPLGDKTTATFGPLIENYYMLAATPSVYKPLLKAFRFGGHGAAFGASTSTGGGLKYVADNGFAGSVTINSKNAENGSGFLTEEDTNKLNAMLAYTSDNYHVSATYTKQSGGWDAWEYFATRAMNIVTGNDIDANGLALRAWFRPDETGTMVPSVSIGYDYLNFVNPAVHDDGRGGSGHGGVTGGSGYSIALNWSDMVQADDRIGLAIGQPIKADGVVGSEHVHSEVDAILWEAYYAFKPNDSMEITTGIFGGTDVWDDEDDDVFGTVLQTTFKF